ncbi:MAG: AAA family ATPase [Richelia sp. CSU_2_1]|nr:AAA family ATPase [Richelia sp. CSU_2_1]
MSDFKFWTPVYQLFKPDEPLMNKDLQDLYVRRDDSPVDRLVNLLAMDDTSAKFLLAGHRGGGKTTELRRLEQKCVSDYIVVWVDTDTALDKYNIGYAEVVVLIGLQIVAKLTELGWKLPGKLEQELLASFARITYQDKLTGGGHLELPKLFQDLGMLLKVGFQRETTTTREVRPALSEIVAKVNEIIAAAQRDKPKLLVIVDGLDRKDFGIALEMFSSSLMTDLNCHIVYAIPISLRYSSAFRQPMQSFDKCLDLANIPVFKCDDKARSTDEIDRAGRHILATVIQKRVGKLNTSYSKLFHAEALDLLCEKSGGVMRDLVRLARTSGEVALRKKCSEISLTVAKDAVREDRQSYTIEDYQFPELHKVRKTGQLSTNDFDSPKYGRIVICDELLHNKLILGYQDPEYGRWFDVNPILSPDLERWRSMNPENLRSL